MAGDWIKMRNDLLDDPAVFRVAGLTGLDRYAVIGRLWAFWTWTDKQHVDGYVDGGTSTLVDAIAAQVGFADALAQVAWLEITPTGLRIPHYERHNGQPAKQRALKNLRQKKWRGNGGDAPVDATASPEKRREEEIKAKEAADAARAARQTLLSPVEQPPEPDPIFGTCLAFLVAKGVTEKSARGFLGLMRKQVGELVCMELVAKAEAQDVSEPIPWLTAAANNAKAKAARNGYQLVSPPQPKADPALVAANAERVARSHVEAENQVRARIGQPAMTPDEERDYRAGLAAMKPFTGTAALIAANVKAITGELFKQVPP